RTNIFPVSVDPLYQQLRFIVTDRAAGSYSSAVDPNNPGQRPTRSGGPYNARYFFTQEEARTDDWRAELARFITSDRQFARATVNHLWAHFFTQGIVDPPDGWDLSRIDPKNPPPEPWTLQPSHPQLIEALADEFIRSNFSIRHMIKLMVQSNAYQLSSRYPGQWRPAYERYFARHLPRRLYAEEIYDAVTTATSTEVPMYVEGFDAPLYYATQLPDPTEPRPKAIGGVNDPKISDFLLTFGRGDWFDMPRNSTSNVLQVLYEMNSDMINFRTFGNRNVTTRVTRIMQAGLSDTDAVHELFLATLGRYATKAELELLRKKKTANYEQWLSDIQWALLNKVDFVFNN
ncbi:MAG TPA: DUF1553 domain-containing protein, partial [Terriglobia bacterium]|nr:DUF1553 domain-containing protein [Terriglobia bacterium]